VTGRASITTRRGFVAAAGFGVVSLYLVWAGYGAAPLGPGDHEEPGTSTGGGHPAEPTGGGHAAGDHSATGSAMSDDEFRRLTQAFVEQHKLPDGSVKPRRIAAAQPPEMDEHTGHGAMASHAAGDAPPPTATAMPDANGEPVEVYLMAYQWGYAPSVLRLEAGVRYRFRMMAVDVAHGASIQLGRGGRIVRLRPGALVEQELTFTQPGEYLLYCTVYCGLPHDRMQGKIIVTPAESQS
jgi:heme/copper-type cytochrome/quinol oxidase subunit 2